jgi:hypothetical protein
LPVPADLSPAFARQLDLVPVVAGTGMTVYANAAWFPQRAETTTPPQLSGGSPATPLVDAHPVLPGPVAATSYSGAVGPGTVLAAVAPAGRWNLTTPAAAGSAPRTQWQGWAASYTVSRPQNATLSFDGGVLTPLADLVAVATWLAAMAALAFRARSRSGSEGNVAGVRRRRVGTFTENGSEAADASAPLEGVVP